MNNIEGELQFIKSNQYSINDQIGSGAWLRYCVDQDDYRLPVLVDRNQPIQQYDWFLHIGRLQLFQAYDQINQMLVPVDQYYKNEYDYYTGDSYYKFIKSDCIKVILRPSDFTDSMLINIIIDNQLSNGDKLSDIPKI